MATLPGARSYILSLTLLTLAPVAASANSSDADGAQGDPHPEIVPEGFSQSEVVSLDVPPVDDSATDEQAQSAERIARCRSNVLALAETLEAEYRVAVSETGRAIAAIIENKSLDQTAKLGQILGQQQARKQFDEMIRAAREVSTPAKLAACARLHPHPPGIQARNRLPNIHDVESLTDSILLQIANQPAQQPLSFGVVVWLWNADF
jgi:hypothetical protein